MTGATTWNLHVPVKHGARINRPALTPRPNIGYFKDTLLGIFFLLNYKSSPKDPYRTKSFPPRKNFASTMRQGLKQWCKDNGLPSFNREDVSSLIDRLWQQHCTELNHHIRRTTISSLLSTFPGAVFHCEDKQASSLRIFCPVLYHSAISKTFLDKDVFEVLSSPKEHILQQMISSLQKQFGRSYPWALGKGQLLPSGYILPKKKKAYASGRPIISFCRCPV